MSEILVLPSGHHREFLREGETAVELEGLHQLNTDFRVFCYSYWLWSIQMCKAWAAVAEHLARRNEPKWTLIVEGDEVMPFSGMGAILIDLYVPVYDSLRKDLEARRRDLFLAWSTHYQVEMCCREEQARFYSTARSTELKNRREMVRVCMAGMMNWLSLP